MDIQETIKQQEREFKENKVLALRRRRLELGLTLAQVAGPAGMSAPHLSMVERGYSASRKMLAKIEAVLAQKEKEQNG